MGSQPSESRSTAEAAPSFPVVILVPFFSRALNEWWINGIPQLPVSPPGSKVQEKGLEYVPGSVFTHKVMLKSPSGEGTDPTWVNKGGKKLENVVRISYSHCFGASSYPVSSLCTHPTLFNDLFVLESKLLITNRMALWLPNKHGTVLGAVKQPNPWQRFENMFLLYIF